MAFRLDCSANNRKKTIVVNNQIFREISDAFRIFLYTCISTFSLFSMMTKKTFFAATVAVLMVGCSAATTENASDTMQDEASSSAMMDDAAEETSSLTFVGGSSILDHDGGFADFTVDVGNSDDLVNSTVTATVDLTSVYTDSEGLTGHLQKEEFFDVENYPEATFTSTEVIEKGENTYDIVGDLTIKGVTKSIIMNATLEDDVFTANFEIPRKEYGIGNDSYGDKLLDEFVPVTATVYLQ